jgi:ribose 1,5-bisphosphokinase PhnN
VVANGSRATVAEIVTRVDNFVVIEVTAPRSTASILVSMS